MEFTVKDMHFRSGVMDTMTAFKVARRVAPFAPSLIVLNAAKRAGQAKEAGLALAPKMLELFALMTDVDAEYVVARCLDIVQIKQGDAGYQSVRVNDRIMFKEIDPFVVAYICWVVLEDTLLPFFDGLASLSPTEIIEPTSNS